MAGQAVIGALRVNLGIDTAAFSAGLKQAGSRLSSFGRVVRTGLLAAAGAATAAGAGMAYAIKGTVDAADQMSKAAAKIGIPIEELSRLKYAADLSGVSFDGLQTGVKRLSANMADALSGVGEGAKAFQSLGINVAGADGRLKSASDVMREVADKFAAMPDGAEKTAVAMRLFGKAGADMIPMLNGGSAALADLMGEADKFGQVFTAEMGKNAEAFNDNMTRMQGAFAAVSAQLAQALLPYMNQFSEWLVANAPAIANFVVGTFELVKAFVDLGVAVVSFVTGAWAQFVAAWDSAVLKVDMFKASMSQLARDIATAFAELPARMIEIGGQIIDGLWQGIKVKATEVKDGIANIAGGMVDSIKAKLGIHSPSRVMHGVGVNIMEGLGNGMESMAGGISSIADSIGQTIGSAFAGVIDGTKSVKDAIKEVLSSLAQMATQMAFRSLLGGFAKSGGFLGSLLGGLVGFADGGSFNVGGAGGIDSQIVAFRASPNERVTVTKPGQTAGLSGGAQEIVIRGVFVDDGGVVKGIAQGEAASAAGKVAQAVPLIADKRQRDSQYRRIGPGTRMVG